MPSSTAFGLRSSVFFVFILLMAVIIDYTQKALALTKAGAAACEVEVHAACSHGCWQERPPAKSQCMLLGATVADRLGAAPLLRMGYEGGRCAGRRADAAPSSGPNHFPIAT